MSSCRRAIYVANLPYGITEPELAEALAGRGHCPSAIRFMVDADGRFSGRAGVAFESEHEAAAALDDLTAATLTVGGRKMFAQHLSGQGPTSDPLGWRKVEWLDAG